MASNHHSLPPQPTDQSITNQHNQSILTSLIVPCRYVGKYFTEEGEFMEEVYAKDLATHVRRFEEGKNYGETKFDHKND